MTKREELILKVKNNPTIGNINNGTMKQLIEVLESCFTISTEINIPYHNLDIKGVKATEILRRLYLAIKHENIDESDFLLEAKIAAEEYLDENSIRLPVNEILCGKGQNIA